MQPSGPSAAAAQAIRCAFNPARDTHAMSMEVALSKTPAAQLRQRTATVCKTVICAFAATGILSTNIFLPSLPAIAADLRVSSAAVTSTITVFLAIVAVGQLIAGPLSDRLGRKMPILTGLCIFVVGTMWCAFAADLPGLLIGRSIQAAGACIFVVLARAIARDLFDGEPLASTMAWITIATAAAPGFSPLLGSGLDHLFGWRAEFAFVAAFAIGAGAAYAAFVGETRPASARSAHPFGMAGTYLGLMRDARFAVPARTTSLMMAGLFAVFSAAPRILLEGFGLSPVMLGLLFAGVVFLVFGAGMLAPKLSTRFGLHRATLIGLVTASAGAAALLLAVLLARNWLPPFLAAASIFLFGLGIVSPLLSAAALSPFGDRAGAAAALFGFAQMAGAACGASLAAVVATDPAIGLGTVLALTSLFALLLSFMKSDVNSNT
jgi:DHA1 family bicyclomycin/chloramphenicol resistance-like MFS transporter